MRLVNVPALRHRVAETLSHTTASVAHAVVRDRPEVAILMNAANAPLLKPLAAARIPTAIHLDGLESRRGKWRGAGAAYFRWAEARAVRWGDAVIADADAIADHVQREYGRSCVVIPYGADLVEPGSARLTELDLVPLGYHLVVARFEPENHVLDAVVGYVRSGESRPLVVVGGSPYSAWYVDRVRTAAATDPRVRVPGPVYDHDLLDQLYANAVLYIHGHSVGGTNPSLLRAMGAGAPVAAFDVEFNREVTAGAAYFWSDADELTGVVDAVASGSQERTLAEYSAAGRERIATTYQWDTVTDQYEELAAELASR
jgi:glycosyltransferase involved in cell wall biosynthesis